MAKKKNDIEAKVEEVAEATPVEAPVVDEKLDAPAPDEIPEAPVEAAPEVEEVKEEPKVEEKKPEPKPEVNQEPKKEKKSILGNYEVISTAKSSDPRAIDKFTRAGIDYVDEQGYLTVTNIKTEKEAKDVQLQILALGYKSEIKVID